MISLKKPAIGSFDIKFDAIGAFASGLCIVHCIAHFFSLHPPVQRVAVIQRHYGFNG